MFFLVVAVSAASSCSLFWFSLVVLIHAVYDRCGPDPSDQGGVPEHPGERTRTDGTEPARHPVPEVVQVSAGRDGAVRPPWIPRNRPRVAPAGAWTPSAATYEADARSPPPTVLTRPGDLISRGGWARQ